MNRLTIFADSLPEVTNVDDLQEHEFYHLFYRSNGRHTIRRCLGYVGKNPDIACYMGTSVWYRETISRWRVFGPISTPEIPE